MDIPKKFEVNLAPDVLDEYKKATAYYNDISPILSQNFKARFELAIYKLSMSPFNYFKLTKKLRRIKLGKFPYMLVYRINNKVVEVLGLFHQAAKPSGWRKL